LAKQLLSVLGGALLEAACPMLEGKKKPTCASGRKGNKKAVTTPEVGCSPMKQAAKQPYALAGQLYPD
jgi:hypothetical protein